MKPKHFFSHPEQPRHRQYEALRAFYLQGLSATQAAELFNFTPAYFKNLRVEFAQQLRNDCIPDFFVTKKTGPNKRSTDQLLIEDIIALRKKNYSIQDIKVVLDAKEQPLALDTIDKILKEAGFAPLPKRTRKQRRQICVPEKIKPPTSAALVLEDTLFSTEHGVGPLLFIPLLKELGIIDAIERANFPGTSTLSSISSILSFIALKILGQERFSHDDNWNLDRALGLFANLNVLPKNTTLSTYSYRVSRKSNLSLLKSLSTIFKDAESEEGDFNLDFKTIPHWGDDSILDRHWSGAHSKVIKGILALVVQDPSTGFISYTDATVPKNKQNECVLNFVDFWKKGRGQAPKMLVFDSKFTTYANLNLLNKDDIGFLTLRRRGQKIVDKALQLPLDSWKKVCINVPKRKHQKIRVFEERCTLNGYEGEVRQIIIRDNGRKSPAFLITNDFDSPLSVLIKKYSRRWLVEQEIAEQIAFFSLNSPSSSIVIKVDFDLTLSLLVHNLYKKIASKLTGFETCTVSTLNRHFFQNGADIEIEDGVITVRLKKKTHLPILFELPWLSQSTWVPWLGAHIRFEPASFS